MISHLILAQLSSDIYDKPEVFDKYWTADDVIVGLKVVDGVNVIVLRGSMTAEDWLRDGDVIPVWHKDLGFVHAGFVQGMDAVFVEVCKALNDNPNEITGHSLGGARARILAALFTVNKIPFQQIWTFGSPKPAFENLKRIIEKSGAVHGSSRFFNDIVPTTPLSIPPFLEYCHTEDYEQLDGHSGQTDLGVLRDHSIENYIKALEVLANSP